MRPSTFFRGAAASIILSATLCAAPLPALAAESAGASTATEAATATQAASSTEQTTASSATQQSDSQQTTATSDTQTGEKSDASATATTTPTTTVSATTPTTGETAGSGSTDATSTTSTTQDTSSSATADTSSSATADTSSSTTTDSSSSSQTDASQTQPATIATTAHVQDTGWQPESAQGTVAGTTGQGKRLEAVKISVKAPDGTTYADSDVRYRAHVQNVGWQQWVSGGQVAGTTGRSLRLEALQIELRDGSDLARDYEVWYRAHVQNVGWMAWTNQGPVGSTGRGLRLEAIEVMLVRKGEDHPTSDGTAFLDGTYVSIAGHVQNTGWTAATSTNGQTVGTTGKGLRLEALRAHVGNAYLSGDVQIQTHVQNQGWQGWTSGGGTAGTTGKGLRIEAVRIQLTGDLQQHYDVWYRAHVQTLGWMSWTKNGDVCGTTGLAGRMEGLQVVLTPKGAAAPSAAGQAVSFSHLDAQQIEYAVSPINGQWESNVQNGNLAGSTGQGKALQAFRVQRAGDTSTLAGDVQYRAFVQNKRWLGWESDDAEAGTSGQGLRLEAVQMRLTGELAKYFDVYYQAHSSDYGWLDWAKDGQTAGTAGYAKAIEALRVKLVLKGTDTTDRTTRPAVVKTSVRKDGNTWKVYGEDGSVYNLGTIAMNTRYINQVSEGAIEGCEAASLLMALWSKGYLTNVSYRTFLTWMPYASDGNPNHGFVGTPYVNGPQIDTMMMPAVTSWGARYAHTKNMTGCSDEDLINELVQGHPVVVWTSVFFRPSKLVHYWWGNYKTQNHVMTLLGFNPHTNQFYVADPYMAGKEWVSWNTFMQTWHVLRGAVSVW